ncbi:hypothetical protein D9M71_438190 [compost metagenome]
MLKRLSRVSAAALPNGAGRSMARPLRLEVTLRRLSRLPRLTCNWYGRSPDAGKAWLNCNQSVSDLSDTWPLALMRVCICPGWPSAVICAVTGLPNACRLMPLPLRPLSKSKLKSPFRRLNSRLGGATFSRASLVAKSTSTFGRCPRASGMSSLTLPLSGPSPSQPAKISPVPIGASLRIFKPSPRLPSK